MLALQSIVEECGDLPELDSDELINEPLKTDHLTEPTSLRPSSRTPPASAPASAPPRASPAPSSAPSSTLVPSSTSSSNVAGRQPALPTLPALDELGELPELDTDLKTAVPKVNLPKPSSSTALVPLVPLAPLATSTSTPTVGAGSQLNQPGQSKLNAELVVVSASMPSKEVLKSIERLCTRFNRNICTARSVDEKDLVVVPGGPLESWASTIISCCQCVASTRNAKWDATTSHLVFLCADDAAQFSRAVHALAMHQTDDIGKLDMSQFQQWIDINRLMRPPWGPVTTNTVARGPGGCCMACSADAVCPPATFQEYYELMLWRPAPPSGKLLTLTSTALAVVPVQAIRQLPSSFFERARQIHSSPKLSAKLGDQLLARLLPSIFALRVPILE